MCVFFSSTSLFLGNANKVCDIVRGMISCHDMSQISDLVKILQSSNEIVVTRVKDRFLDAPSGGGWRDCMVNFFVKEDPNKHVCELQIVHNQMLTARKGLPGHLIYNRVRNADELVRLNPETPETKEELQQWLVQWQGVGKEGEKGYVVSDRITRGDPNMYDVSNITDMKELFAVPELKEFNDPIGTWDVSNVVTMESMFSMCTLFNQRLDAWDTHSCTNMSYMFRCCKSFGSAVDKDMHSNMHSIGKWKTGQVRTMQGMFDRAPCFNDDIGDWNTANVRNMASMFRGATAFNCLSIGNWNTEKVNGMQSMFENAPNFGAPLNPPSVNGRSVPSIANWDTGNVRRMSSMFRGASSFNLP